MYEVVEVESCAALVRKAVCRHDQMGPTIGRLFHEIISGNPQADLIDAPRVYYREWRPEDCEIEAALPVDPGTGPADGTTLRVYPATQAAMMEHRGGYDGLPDAWMRFYAELQRDGVQPQGYPWDSFVVGLLQEQDDTQWITELYVPLPG